MAMAHVWGTPTDVEITPIGYKLGDTLYLYDKRTDRPIWWDGYWIIDMAADYEHDNPDEDSTSITTPMGAEWENLIDMQLARFDLTLGTLHAWNEYDLIEL